MDWLHVTGVHAIQWFQSTFSVCMIKYLFIDIIAPVLYY